VRMWSWKRDCAHVKETSAANCLLRVMACLLRSAARFSRAASLAAPMTAPTAGSPGIRKEYAPATQLQGACEVKILQQS
jgi:hypothetical protein